MNFLQNNMESLHNIMVAALQLNGLSESTQKAYVREVRLLATHFNRSPDTISEEELQTYFLFRKNTCQLKPSSMRMCYAGIKFFYKHVLHRNWSLLDLVRAKTERRLPTVLSQEEVRKIIQCTTTLHNQIYFITVYSCGLRLTEGLHLQVEDINSSMMMIHVHRGKGAKDRYVPLPHETLKLLRMYWKTHRNPTFIFPATSRSHHGMDMADRPMHRSSVQGAFRRARLASGVQKRILTIHTLRHSYATHLLEAGVNIRAIQRYMGHDRLETTMIYLHLTKKGQEDAYERIDSIMKEFDHD